MSGGAEPPAAGEPGGLVPRGDVWHLGVAAAAGGRVEEAWRLAAGDAAAGAPAPRNAHSLTHLGNGRVLCHGGWHPFVRTFGDTALLAITT
jgi:hypothetical protein